MEVHSISFHHPALSELGSWTFFSLALQICCAITHTHTYTNTNAHTHSCLIVGLVYLQRIKDIDRDGKRTILTSYTIQRLLLTALMLASKFLDEPHCTNKQVVMSFPRRALSLCSHCALSLPTRLSPYESRTPDSHTNSLYALTSVCHRSGSGH